MMEEKKGAELVRAYAVNYRLPPDSVTEEMVMRHWNLERDLTNELLQSSPDERWETFERCYGKLYGELQWLNELPRTTDSTDPSDLYAGVVGLIKPEDRRIYEIGSGKATLISYLASCGHECKATEITRERGEKWVEDVPNLTWGVTDGVHPDRFEEPGSWDVVISNHVIEHMHPDDLDEHFRSVYAILSPGGRYIVSSPHRFSGPHDVSRVFGCDISAGMHLKEYTYGELAGKLRAAGFRTLKSSLRIPKRLMTVKPVASGAYLAYLRALETALGLIPSAPARRKAQRLARALLFQSNIILSGQKPTK